MDETGFIQKQNYRKVVFSKGSSNVWSKYDDANLYMTFVVCVSAAETVAPPLLIVPGNWSNRDVPEGCDIKGAHVTTPPKVFINSTLFLNWIVFFAKSVPDSVARPLVLVYNGCCIHYNSDIIKTDIGVKVMLVLFPANATHLIEPLGIAFFNH